MTRVELVAAVAEQAGLLKKDAEKVIDAILDAMTSAMNLGEDVRLQGFGTFSVSDRPERAGRNPKTGEPMTIAAGRVAKFKPASQLRDSLNAGKGTP